MGRAGIVAALLATACSGNSPAPTTPGAPDTSGGTSTQTCRVYATAHSGVTKDGSGVVLQNLAYTYSYSTTTNRLVGTLTTTVPNASPHVQSLSGQYSSVADFIDEVAVIPGRTRLKTWVQSEPGSNANHVFSFDAQNRLTSQLVNTAINTPPSSVTSTWTYTAWDSDGRPTTGSLVIVQGATQTLSWPLSITYNNVTRTSVTTYVTGNNSTSQLTQVFDINGWAAKTVSSVSNAPLTSVQTTDFTITATEKVCR